MVDASINLCLVVQKLTVMLNVLRQVMSLLCLFFVSSQDVRSSRHVGGGEGEVIEVIYW